jgi:LuxR family maltose regulon positive regulatory protein
MEIAESVGAPFVIAETCFGLSQAWHALGDHTQARTSLTRARRMGERYGSQTLAFQCALIDAWYRLEAGDEPAAAGILTRAFARAKRLGHAAFAWWRQDVMAQLCWLALESGIEPVFTRNLIRQFTIPPPQNKTSEAWPWPVKVFTLGRFDIERDNEPVNFGAKAPRKPLELLKALIALGGNASETRLIDALWPDAAGDAGHSAFTTTVQRLRQVLGGDAFIMVRDGRVSLDPQRVWVDAAAFERLINTALQNKKKDGHVVSLEKALALYQGPFLEEDEDRPWSAPARERIRLKHLDAAAALGALHERSGRHAEAAKVYRKGLDVDPLSENLYQRLMICQMKLGYRAEAIRTYQRCSSVLASSLGVTPSDETERIYRSVRGK